MYKNFTRGRYRMRILAHYFYRRRYDVREYGIMSEFWKSWLISLLLVGIASTLVQILTHGGRSEKTVKKCAGIILSLVIVAPVPAMLSSISSCSQTDIDKIYDTDSGYNDYTKDYLAGIITDKICDELEKIGIDGASVALDATGSSVNMEINFVIIKLPSGVIDENQQHINKRKQIIAAVTEVVDIPQERIIIYE